MKFCQIEIGTRFRRNGTVLVMKIETTYSEVRTPRNIVFLENGVGWLGFCKDDEEVKEEYIVK